MTSLSRGQGSKSWTDLSISFTVCHQCVSSQTVSSFHDVAIATDFVPMVTLFHIALVIIPRRHIPGQCCELILLSKSLYIYVQHRNIIVLKVLLNREEPKITIDFEPNSSTVITWFGLCWGVSRNIWICQAIFGCLGPTKLFFHKQRYQLAFYAANRSGIVIENLQLIQRWHNALIDCVSGGSGCTPST